MEEEQGQKQMTCQLIEWASIVHALQCSQFNVQKMMVEHGISSKKINFTSEEDIEKREQTEEARIQEERETMDAMLLEEALPSTASCADILAIAVPWSCLLGTYARRHGRCHPLPPPPLPSSRATGKGGWEGRWGDGCDTEYVLSKGSFFNNTPTISTLHRSGSHIYDLTVQVKPNSDHQ